MVGHGRLLIVTRAVVPSWPVARRVQMTPLLALLPAEDPLAVAYRRLRTAIDEIGQISAGARQCAGVPLQDIQDATGHADPRTTRRYMATHRHLDRHATYAFAAWLRRTPSDEDSDTELSGSA